jgi:hypothetical protein
VLFVVVVSIGKRVGHVMLSQDLGPGHGDFSFYAIVSGNGMNTFAIDPVLGYLTFARCVVVLQVAHVWNDNAVCLRTELWTMRRQDNRWSSHLSFQ